MKKVDLSQCPRLQQIQWPSVVVEKLNVTWCISLKTITLLSLLDTARRITSCGNGSLCYVQRCYKIEDVGNVDLQVINNIGFFNLDSMANVDLTIVNRFQLSRMKRPAQYAKFPSLSTIRTQIPYVSDSVIRASVWIGPMDQVAAAFRKQTNIWYGY
ncbi:unnamed protein product [Ilex paraguariensis]|uniref:Uncharacterized protein n=1 Tax=Ilex paraguariensis TaxID=185542 RepID=A0ABC8TFH2_9AQUA